jgi:CHRD domain/PKD-like domain/Right handed beta helix region
LNLTGGAAGNTYLWAGPNTFTSTAQSPTIANATALATGTYTITVTNSTNCTATATVAVTVNAVPTATASSNSPVCVGNTISLTGGGVGTYLWTGPGGYSSTAQSPIIANATVGATGTYTITVTNTNSCTSTATTAVTVNGISTASVTPSTQTICSGGAITTIAITGSGTSYTWTRDNTTSATGIAASGSGDISGSLTNTTEVPITVTFTITPVGSCNGTPITATVVVNPIPTATASTPSQTICSGQFITGITFNNPAPLAPLAPDPSSDVIPVAPKETKGIGLSSFVAGTVFNWTRDNTVTVTGIPASGSGNISGILTNNTSSPVTVTFTITPSYSNAGTTCTGTPITVTVTVNPNPASATITDAGTAFCSGSSTTLSAPADPNYTYAWERSLSGIANPNSFTAFGGTAQTQVVTTSGIYRSVVTNQYNCSARDTTAVKFGDFVFSGSLSTGDATQTGRMNRFGVVSTCAAPKSYPGDFTTSGSRLYDSYTVTNPTNAPICATIGISSGCGVNMFSIAYLGSYNPAALATNYLADPGSSFPNTGFYEATIPANGTIVVIVHEVNTGTGCSNYNLRVDVPGATVLPTASSNSPICAGNSLNLTGTGTGTYAWTGPNSFTSSVLSPTIANATTLATGTYTISVTNTNGCVFNATTAVTVNALPTATASSNSPICAGNTLNLTGGGVGTAYAWVASNGYTSNVQSPTISNATVSASGTYTITVTNANGCTSTASVVVTVNETPIATASSSTPTICAGNSISLTGGGVGTYAWAGPNSFSSTAQSPTISNATVSATGTYTVTVTNVNGCTSTASVAITVNALPTATASTSTPSICAGTSISLMGGGVGTYLWTGPNGYTSSAQSPTISSPTVLASGVYRITVTNANNCTSTATTSVTVNPLPVVDAGANQTICEGSTASLTATCNLLTVSTTLSGASEVPPNASTATGTVSGTFDKVTKQLLLTISFNGLTANASAAHIHKGAVGVNGGVVIGFPVVPSATSGSFTYTGTLTTTQEADLLAGLYYVNVHNASFPGGEIRGQLSTACVANNFVWNPGNLSGQTVTVSPSTTQIYTVTASNTTTGCSTTATTTVNVNPRPVVTIGSNTPVCVGNTLNLTSGGGTTYAWTSSNGFTSTDQNPSISSVTVSASGTYTVTVTNASGCINTATTVVEINALPTATASSNSPICSGVTLNLTGGGVGTYSWTSSNGFTSTDQNPSIANATASMSGTYMITVTNANGCTSTATTSVTINPITATPTPQANTQIIFGASITLTATGCSGVNDVLKWYQSADNALVTMPVSPTATTNYYAKCETTLNGITCISGNSTDVTVTVLQPNPPVATGATNCLGTPTTLTATGCSGSVGTFVLKWYQNADDALVTMPVSPTTTTDYYAKCEQTFNAVTAVSAKSNVVTLTILNPPTPVSTGGTIYNGQSISLTATGCSGALGTFTLKWYQTSDNALVTMPVSPTVTTQYYSKCEQTANSVTCLSPKSNDVSVTVVNRIFVDIAKVAAPIQNGNSWATAYGNLQTGLGAATAGVEVWVAKGTYKPTNTTTRTIYFNIPNNVKVYGGFAGTEDNLIDRNFRTNISILSGDIGTLNLDTDNSYHVVVMDGSSNTTVLDGFTVTGGYANFDDKRIYNAPLALPTTASIETGGGIVVQSGGSPTIANCTVIRNAAVTGGGLFSGDASTPTIMFCKFMGNQAGFGSGLYFQDGSNGVVNNTLISGNKGIGAVYNNNSNPIITNVTFGGNGGYNGGIFNSNSQPVVKNSIIWGNSTPFNDTQSIITYSTIQGGYAGTGNLSVDPKFVNPTPDGLSPSTNGDYHVQASSLTIDRGDNGTISLTDTDLDGNLRRFASGRVDMGAYEFQGTATATLVISVATGNWESNSTWDVGRVPQLGDYVIIDSNHIVTLNGTGIAKNLEYRGTGQLKFNTTTSKLEIGF